MLEKIFKAYDVRATYPSPLNEEAAWKVGHATAQFLKGKREEGVRQKDIIIVGRDMRPHSPSLANALIDGIRSTGMNVVDIGMVDTAMVYFAINHEDCVGGIQTTASHNPANYNGFKISGPKAKPIGAASGLDDIKRTALTLTRSAPTASQGRVEQRDLWQPYREKIQSFLHMNRPVRVSIDASNGMAGKLIPRVFGDTPNLEIDPILFEITGSFVHDPNPLVEQNLAMLQARMRQSKADFGVCFDGDADRCIFLDENGQTIGSDMITALIARYLLQKPENRGSTVVYDLRSSHVVADEVKALGGVPRRDRVGHAFIKKTMAETKAVFGGELSGHLYFRDYYFADSAAVAFAVVLSIVSGQQKRMSELIAPLNRYAQSGEVNFQVEDKDGTIQKLADKYKKGQIDYLDGITVDLGDWWFNVRKSNTEPLLRLNLEANTPRLRDEKFEELKRILGEPVHGH